MYDKLHVCFLKISIVLDEAKLELFFSYLKLSLCYYFIYFVDLL